MERRADGQQHRPLDAVLGRKRDRALNRFARAADHHLARRIIVGDGADLAFGRSLGNGTRRLEIGA